MFEYLTEFYYFEDSIQAVFKDYSSLILQFNGTFTYFDKNGQGSKQRLENCRKFDNTYEKVMETLEVARQYTYMIPEQLNYDEIEKNKKITSYIWPIVGERDKNWLFIQSQDKYANLKFNLKDYKIHVKYYSCKQPIALIDGSENNKDYVNAYTQQFEFNDFMKKYNLKTNKTTVTCSLGYQYRVIEKTYSLINLPKQWWVLLFIVLKTHLEDSLIQQFAPFNQELIDYLKYDQEERDQYFQSEYGFYKLKDSIVTLQFEEQKPSKHLPNDNVPPTTNKISQMHLKKPIFMLQGSNQFWFQSNGGLGCVGEQILVREGIFWHLGNEKWEQSIYNDKYQLDIMDKLCKFIEKQRKDDISTKEHQYNIEYVIEPMNYDIIREVEIREVGQFTLLKNGSVKGRFIDRTIVRLQYPPPTQIHILTNMGENVSFDFTPEITEQYYQNINYIYQYIPQEYIQYVGICIDLAEESYVCSQIQENRQIYQSQLDQWIQSEMENNTRYLVLTGKQQLKEELSIPRDNEDIQLSIEQMLSMNKLMLEKLKIE